MKTAFFIILLGAVTSCFAVWTSSPSNNASALGMSTANFEYSMAYAGTLSGFLFGLFLWKVR
jgi:hypothetical protein